MLDQGELIRLEKECVEKKLLYIRPAQFWGGFSGQTPSLSLTQTETSYQFLGPYDIVLQRPKSFKVGHFKANIEIYEIYSALLQSSQVVVKRCCRDPKIGMESRFGSNSMMEFVWKIPPKLGWPITDIPNVGFYSLPKKMGRTGR